MLLACDIRGTVTQLCLTSEALYLRSNLLTSRYKVTIALYGKCGTKRKLNPLTQNATGMLLVPSYWWLQNITDDLHILSY